MQSRTQILQGLIILCSTVVALRLGYLQLIDQSSKVRAEAATIDKQVLLPSRGLIFDRYDSLLVYNVPVFNLYLTYNRMNKDIDHDKLIHLLGLDEEDYYNRLNRDWTDYRYSPNVPFLFLSKIPYERFIKFLEFKHEFPGFTYEVQSIRDYEYPIGSHLLGYLSEIDPDQLKERTAYRSGDIIGTSGIEKYYEFELRGRKGIEYQLKDNFGRRVGAYENGFLNQNAAAGRDLHISIDRELQLYAEKLFHGKTGSIVAIEPSTGDILAFVSSPHYNPQELSNPSYRSEAFEQLQNDTRLPFFNRGTMAKYPPGSTLKPILALIGLQENLVRPKTLIKCTGAYHYKIYRWGCHAGPGTHNVTSAISRSCNTYFYSLYRNLIDQYGFQNPEAGISALNEYFYQFGLGKPLGIDLPQESSGLIPDTTFYDNLYLNKGDWRSTYIISNGIGQGEMELTTLQMANLAAILANRGHYYTPHLLRYTESEEEGIVDRKYQRNEISIDQKHYDPVLDGMELAISNGTARMAYIPGVRVCGKTGTSENPHGKDHSVFYAFAPRENPKIAIAVYIENAGWGSSFAAPIGGLIMEQFLNDEIHRSRQWIEDRMLTVSTDPQS